MLLNTRPAVLQGPARSGNRTATGYVDGLTFSNICRSPVKDSSEAKANCVLKMSTDHTTMFISKQPSYLIISALPFPLWIILISLLKAYSAPLRYLKLQHNTELQTVAECKYSAEAQSSILLIFILQALPMSGAFYRCLKSPIPSFAFVI